MRIVYDVIGGLLFLAAIGSWFLSASSTSTLLIFIASAIFMVGSSLLVELREIRLRLPEDLNKTK